MQQPHSLESHMIFDDKTKETPAISEKLIDLLTPGLNIEFSPDEAVKAGAFVEDALSEDDAQESSLDMSLNSEGEVVAGGINND